MKTSIFTIFLTATALWLSSCMSGRIASATEYDSVYFGKNDQIVYNQAQDGEDNQRQPQYAQDTDESRDDDFYYSRRIRRFNDNNDWRYYDPYNSNDLYFSMGTNSWNTWNNNGWYNPTSPFIGSPWGYYNGLSSFGYGYGNGYWGCYNSPYMWGSYNPWMNNYYGYNPWTWGYCGYNYGMYNPYYYSMYSPWNNPYCYYPYTYTNSNNVAVGTIMPNRGVTSGLAPATGMLSSGTRPPLGTTGRNNTGTVITPTNSNNTGSLTAGSPVRYTTPRSNVEFGNKPPKTYTASELGTSRPSTSPSGTWNNTKGNTSPSNTNRPPVYTAPSEIKGNTSPSNTNRPPVYTAPSETKGNSSPVKTDRPAINNTPKETSRPPKSSWTPSDNNQSTRPAPSRSESSSRPSMSAPSNSSSGGNSGGSGRRPR